MTAEELDEKAIGIIEAYKGFKILADGSKKDKVFFILILLLFFIISSALFITNVFIDNFIVWVISLICWVVHRKEYMYEGIIYYLSLGLLLENWDMLLH